MYRPFSNLVFSSSLNAIPTSYLFQCLIAPFQDQAGGWKKQFCVWVILITTNRVRPMQSKSEGATWVSAPPNFYITLSSGKRQVAHFENSSDSPCQTDYLSVVILLHMSYSIFDDWMTEKKLSQYEKSTSQDHTTRSPQYVSEILWVVFSDLKREFKSLRHRFEIYWQPEQILQSNPIENHLIKKKTTSFNYSTLNPATSKPYSFSLKRPRWWFTFKLWNYLKACLP